jgi:NitT/TauT family transport system permease protein
VSAAAGAGEAATVLRGPTALDRVREWLPAAVLFVGLIVLWEAAVRVFAIQQFILPRPSAILDQWSQHWDELTSGAGYTLGEVLLGLAIGVVGGLVAGGVTARFAGLRDAVMPFAVAINAIPIIAFAPVFNNLFGLDKQLSKAMVAAALCFFPVMINTVRGLLSAPAPAIELMRSYAASDAAIFLKVRVPAAVPYIFTALRVSATLATIGAVIGEYFGAPKVSLGQYIVTYTSYLNFERAWAAIIYACAMGIGLYVAVVLAERLLAPWATDRTGPGG